MSRSRDPKSLSDLEAAAIGCIHANQPCTAHFIRTQFSDSPSPRFSNSAGSVYPMMRRLEDRGLLRSRSRREGHRDVSYYSCTRSGIEMLRKWIGPPLDARAAITIDPLRTRILSLGLLNRSEQENWFHSAETILKDHLRSIDRRQTLPSRTIYTSLADEYARIETLARLRWLKEARKQLSNNSEERPD